MPTSSMVIAAVSTVVNWSECCDFILCFKGPVYGLEIAEGDFLCCINNTGNTVKEYFREIIELTLH